MMLMQSEFLQDWHWELQVPSHEPILRSSLPSRRHSWGLWLNLSRGWEGRWSLRLLSHWLRYRRVQLSLALFPPIRSVGESWRQRWRSCALGPRWACLYVAWHSTRHCWMWSRFCSCVRGRPRSPPYGVLRRAQAQWSWSCTSFLLFRLTRWALGSFF